MAHSHSLRQPLARRTCPPPSSSLQDVSRQRQRQANPATGCNGKVMGRSASQQESSPSANRFSAFLGNKHCSEVNIKSGNRTTARKQTSRHGGTHVTLNVPRLVSTISDKAISTAPSTPEPVDRMVHTPSVAFTDPLPQQPTELLYETPSVSLTRKRLVPMLNLGRHSLSRRATERATCSRASGPARNFQQVDVQSTSTSEVGSAQSAQMVQDSRRSDVPSMHAHNAGGDKSAATGQDHHHAADAQDMHMNEFGSGCSESLGKDGPKHEHMPCKSPPHCSSRVAWSDLVDQREQIEPNFERLIQQALGKTATSCRDAHQCDVRQQTPAADNSSFSAPLSPDRKSVV